MLVHGVVVDQVLQVFARALCVLLLQAVHEDVQSSFFDDLQRSLFDVGQAR